MSLYCSVGLSSTSMAFTRESNLKPYKKSQNISSFNQARGKDHCSRVKGTSVECLWENFLRDTKAKLSDDKIVPMPWCKMLPTSHVSDFVVILAQWPIYPPLASGRLLMSTSHQSCRTHTLTRAHFSVRIIMKKYSITTTVFEYLYTYSRTFFCTRTHEKVLGCLVCVIQKRLHTCRGRLQLGKANKEEILR